MISGRTIPASSTMIEITTTSSVSVNPARVLGDRRLMLDRAEVGEVVIGAIHAVLSGADENVTILLPRCVRNFRVAEIRERFVRLAEDLGGIPLVHRAIGVDGSQPVIRGHRHVLRTVTSRVAREVILVEILANADRAGVAYRGSFTQRQSERGRRSCKRSGVREDLRDVVRTGASAVRDDRI